MNGCYAWRMCSAHPGDTFQSSWKMSRHVSARHAAERGPVLRLRGSTGSSLRRHGSRAFVALGCARTPSAGSPRHAQHKIVDGGFEPGPAGLAVPLGPAPAPARGASEGASAARPGTMTSATAGAVCGGEQQPITSAQRGSLRRPAQHRELVAKHSVLDRRAGGVAAERHPQHSPHQQVPLERSCASDHAPRVHLTKPRCASPHSWRQSKQRRAKEATTRTCQGRGWPTCRLALRCREAASLGGRSVTWIAGGQRAWMVR